MGPPEDAPFSRPQTGDNAKSIAPIDIDPDLPDHPTLGAKPPIGAPDLLEAAPDKPKLDEKGIPIAWILQVASVSSSQKAEQLRKQLLELGHKAYTKTIQRGDNTLIRVYIGPKFERDKLHEAKEAIDREFRVNSIVARYVP